MRTEIKRHVNTHFLVTHLAAALHIYQQIYSLVSHCLS